MPSPLNVDAVSYLKQQGIPITSTSLNHTMGLLQQQPNLRPSYAGQGTIDVDPETMKPIQSGGSLPPLQSQGSTNQSFSQAFKAARKQLGAGKTFEWNGKKYTTDYKEEVGNRPQTDKFGPDASEEQNEAGDVNEAAESEMLDDLNAEKMGNVDGSSKGPALNRGNYSDNAEAGGEMDAMLATLLGGGAVAAGAGAYAASRNRNKDVQQPMGRGDLYGKQPEAGVMSDEDLYGQPDKTQKMSDSDIFINDQTDRMMQDSDIMLPQSEKDSQFLSSITEDNGYLPEEVQGAKAVQSKNKIAAKNAYNKLKGIQGVDKRLLSILKGLM